MMKSNLQFNHRKGSKNKICCFKFSSKNEWCDDDGIGTSGSLLCALASALVSRYCKTIFKICLFSASPFLMSFLTIYAPMIYTAPCVMFFDAGRDSTWGSGGGGGGGVGPGKNEFFGPQLKTTTPKLE